MLCQEIGSHCWKLGIKARREGIHSPLPKHREWVGLRCRGEGGGKGKPPRGAQTRTCFSLKWNQEPGILRVGLLCCLYALCSSVQFDVLTSCRFEFNSVLIYFYSAPVILSNGLGAWWSRVTQTERISVLKMLLVSLER